MLRRFTAPLVLVSMFFFAGALTGQETRPSLVPRPANASDRIFGLIPVPAASVRLEGGFWGPRQLRNAKVTIPHDLDECVRTGRIRNFEIAAGTKQGGFTGYFFDDSDVYKAIEACGIVLGINRDVELERRADAIIDTIAGAQEEDGYIYTSRTINDPKNPPPGGKQRWADMQNGHELYCAGHLYEAGVAYKRGTGKDKLLQVALKNAELVYATFGRDKNPRPCGHPEIEYGLLALHTETGDHRWLELAQWFIDVRGRPEKGRALFGDYCQDHKPVGEQAEAVGHAVRFAYLFGAAIEVARRTGRADLLLASEAVWNDTLEKKSYLTGGIGSTGNNEGFGAPYDLPNSSAYNETCSSIAQGMFSHKLLLATGDTGYGDVVERVLYNAFHSGWGLDGKSFFYPNPLASKRGATRAPWFGCACCPPNVARFVAGLGGLVFATAGNDVVISQFMSGEATIERKSGSVKIAVETNYPWGGTVAVRVTPFAPEEFRVRMRVPGWMRDEPLPRGLYRTVRRNGPRASPRVTVNGAPQDVDTADGWISLSRRWTEGDTIMLSLPMRVESITADERVASCSGRLALMRGPIVYAFEGLDNPDCDLDALVIDQDATWTPTFMPDLLGGVTVLSGMAREAQRQADGSVVLGDARPVKAVPYFAWANRGATPMQVWMPRDISAAKPPPLPTLASRSKVTASAGSGVENVADRVEPTSSNDHDSPYFHWWPQKGSTVWVQYDLPAGSSVSGVEVYWFDDTGRGECRVPKSWRLLQELNGEWISVQGQGIGGVEKDRYNRVTFAPISPRSLRLEMTSQDTWAGGIHEWRLIEAPR